VSMIFQSGSNEDDTTDSSLVVLVAEEMCDGCS
jgi:hypothetical protein